MEKGWIFVMLGLGLLIPTLILGITINISTIDSSNPEESFMNEINNLDWEYEEDMKNAEMILQEKALEKFCKTTSTEIIESKFDSGMLADVEALLNANITRPYAVLLFVADQNKATVEKLLVDSYSATDASSTERLSFVTAILPLTNIPKLSLHDEIARIGEGELYELPAILTKYENKTWVQIDPIQCQGNPWEQDWIMSHDNEFASLKNIDEFTVVKNYFEKQGIVIFEIKTAKTHNSVCLSCSCARGDTMYLLVDIQDVDKITDLGFVISILDD